MNKDVYVIEVVPFSKEEKEELKQLIRYRRKLRRYTSRKALYHDLIVKGCKCELGGIEPGRK